MMSPEDDRLIRFLRQHRPSPPSPEAFGEEQLMQIIAHETNLSRNSRRLRLGAIAGIIGTIFLLLCGYYRGFNAHPQVATLSDKDLESLLIDTWNDTSGESRNEMSVTSTEMIWTNVTEPHLTYSLYHP